MRIQNLPLVMFFCLSAQISNQHNIWARIFWKEEKKLKHWVWLKKPTSYCLVIVIMASANQFKLDWPKDEISSFSKTLGGSVKSQEMDLLVFI